MLLERALHEGITYLPRKFDAYCHWKCGQIPSQYRSIRQLRRLKRSGYGGTVLFGTWGHCLRAEIHGLQHLLWQRTGHPEKVDWTAMLLIALVGAIRCGVCFARSRHHNVNVTPLVCFAWDSWASSFV